MSLAHVDAACAFRRRNRHSQPTGRADRLRAKTTVPAGRDRCARLLPTAGPRRRLSDRARDPTELHARRAAGDLGRRRATPPGRARIGPGLRPRVLLGRRSLSAAARDRDRQASRGAGLRDLPAASAHAPAPQCPAIDCPTLCDLSVRRRRPGPVVASDPSSAWRHQHRHDRRPAVTVPGERDPEAQGRRGRRRRPSRQGACAVALPTVNGRTRRIRFGPLDGREGRYAGPRRNLAQVLVTLLGRQVVVLVAADAIEAKAG
jgi:hypothetical protein